MQCSHFKPSTHQVTRSPVWCSFENLMVSSFRSSGCWWLICDISLDKAVCYPPSCRGEVIYPEATKESEGWILETSHPSWVSVQPTYSTQHPGSSPANREGPSSLSGSNAFSGVAVLHVFQPTHPLSSEPAHLVHVHLRKLPGLTAWVFRFIVFSCPGQESISSVPA